MKRHLNTLFVTTQGAYLAREREAVVVRVDRESRLRVPVHTLGGIVCFGRVSCSPSLLGLCGERGVAVSFLTNHGRFLARAHGYTHGNVLLRREQYRRADNSENATVIARAMVVGKIANARAVLLRSVRDHPERGGLAERQAAVTSLQRCVQKAAVVESLETLRGIEGEAARTYYGVFNHLITAEGGHFAFRQRSRRPPLDNLNSLLSFLYAMLGHDARAACEAAGLDPAVGFLHRDRPGRPSLALDLVEEFRAFLADRLALSLVNRRQVKPSGFVVAESGAVRMDDETRKTVLVAYQERKQEDLTHPYLSERTTVGLLMHLQARLLSRVIRGDIDEYPPFLWR